MDVGRTSVPSDAHPSRNEDVAFALADRGFFGVFDGMGGGSRADLASRVTAQEVQEVLAPLAPAASSEAVADTLRDAFFAADRAVQATAFVRGSDPRAAGTTAVVAVVRPVSAESWSAVIGWVGDSRALVLPAGGRVFQTLTLDDSAVRLAAGSVAQARKVQAALGAVTDDRELSLVQRNLFLERHLLLQAIGTSLHHVHMTERTLTAGDDLVLVSDGVHNNLTDVEMAAVVRRAASAQRAASALVRAAQARSRDRNHVRAKPDDMTAIVIRLGES